MRRVLTTIGIAVVLVTLWVTKVWLHRYLLSLLLAP